MQNNPGWRGASIFTFFLAFLVLLGGRVLDGAQEREDDASLRVDAYRRHHHLAGTLHDVGAGEEHGVHVGALFDLIRLTSEGRLIDFEIVALNDNAICGQKIAIFDLESMEKMLRKM